MSHPRTIAASKRRERQRAARDAPPSPALGHEPIAWLVLDGGRLIAEVPAHADPNAIRNRLVRERFATSAALVVALDDRSTR